MRNVLKRRISKRGKNTKLNGKLVSYKEIVKNKKLMSPKRYTQ